MSYPASPHTQDLISNLSSSSPTPLHHHHSTHSITSPKSPSQQQHHQQHISPLQQHASSLSSPSQVVSVSSLKRQHYSNADSSRNQQLRMASPTAPLDTKSPKPTQNFLSQTVSFSSPITRNKGMNLLSATSASSGQKISVPYKLLASLMQRIDQLEKEMEIMRSHQRRRRTSGRYSVTAADEYHQGDASVREYLPYDYDTIREQVSQLYAQVTRTQADVNRNTREIDALKEMGKLQFGSGVSASDSAPQKANVVGKDESPAVELAPQKRNQQAASSVMAETSFLNHLSHAKDYMSAMEMESLIEHLHTEWTKDLEKTKKELLHRIDSEPKNNNKNGAIQHTQLHRPSPPTQGNATHQDASLDDSNALQQEMNKWKSMTQTLQEELRKVQNQLKTIGSDDASASRTTSTPQKRSPKNRSLSLNIDQASSYTDKKRTSPMPHQHPGPVSPYWNNEQHQAAHYEQQHPTNGRFTSEDPRREPTHSRNHFEEAIYDSSDGDNRSNWSSIESHDIEAFQSYNNSPRSAAWAATEEAAVPSSYLQNFQNKRKQPKRRNHPSHGFSNVPVVESNLRSNNSSPVSPRFSSHMAHPSPKPKKRRSKRG